MARALRIAEVRAEHLLTELLSVQGWGASRPPKGDLLRQQEYKDYPHLLEIFKGKSKSSGGGDGLPEALLVDEHLQPLAVIEVKGSPLEMAKAVDEVTNQYGTWCVEAGFSPLAIALAGASADEFELKVFKSSRNKWVPVTYEGNPINWIPNRADLEILKVPGSATELRPSIPPPEVLAAKADEINRLLREASITDAQRPAIVGAIMLALWKSKGKIRRDPEYILGDINEAAQQAFWTANKPKIAASLNVPIANVALARGAIRIASILERLNVTVLNAETDYLGQLYETFFKYVGGNTIGQVFTPRHIAAFMAELTNVERDDNVLDPTCGTGGFLIAAMNRVQRRSKLSRAQIVEIVKEHLLGFEDEPTTAALCVANMIFRGDGSTKVNQGSCFTSKEFRPDWASIVLMNPPFPHKSTDRPPEEFIARALEGSRHKGILAAIIPQSLLVKREKQEWRDRLLQKHTLLGVVVLPDELFMPFASAFTAILILQKGVVHAHNRQVFFAKLSNDGLRLKKNVRVETKGDQLPLVLAAYKDGGSVSRLCGWSLLDKSESLWHPASPRYVPTSILTIEEVRDGVAYLTSSRSAFVVRHAKELQKMLKAVEAKEIAVKSIRSLRKQPTAVEAEPGTIGAFFDIYGGQRELHSKENLSPGQSLVISSSGADNGAYGFFDFPILLEPPFVTVPGTGSIGEAHVQEWPCGVSDHCYLLVPKPGVEHELLYIASAAIRREIWRFSYGAQITPRRIAWFPLPHSLEDIALVRESLASAKRIEDVAFEEAADVADAALARSRLLEPTVSGQALEDRLNRLELAD
jgi:predicted RNA methylase